MPGRVLHCDGEGAGAPGPVHSAAFARLRRDARWNDWRWQLRRSARGPAALRAWFEPALDVHDEAAAAFPMCVTPYYASLARAPLKTDPILRLCAPDVAELRGGRGLAGDPFDEAAAMPVPGLIRRYRDRAVLLATDRCAVYCRHCTRKHSVGGARGGLARAAFGGFEAAREAPVRLQAVTAYLRRHPEIREVLVSGGDPLLLSDDRIDALLRAVRSVSSIEIVRVGTRVPVTLPQRITPRLARILSRHHPLWLNTHFNHPAELSADAAAACARLADAGIPLGNQTVLLRGLNDRPGVLETLCRGLLRMRVRPYYLLQCDPVAGAGHFRVPIPKGAALVRELRRRLSGLGVPQYVRDIAGAPGKVPVPGASPVQSGGSLRRAAYTAETAAAVRRT